MKTIRSSTNVQNTGSSASNGITGIGRRLLASGRSLRLACIALLFIGCSALSSFASDPIGIYALVDKVVLEPSDSAPERVQVWGGFALAEGRGEAYTPAQRGYMYFKLTPDKETICRNEWSDLKSVAGTGKIVSFGRRHISNGTVRKPDARPENPDVYPIGFGLQKVSTRDYKPINELNALKAAKASDKK